MRARWRRTSRGSRPTRTPMRWLQAAERAGAHEMILALPGGYDCQVAAGGAALSGGQRQRLALARTFYGDPAVVILDEPNAHLDAEGVEALNRAVAALKARGGAAVIVAHHPGVFAQCEQVLAMEHGQVRQAKPERITGPASPGRAIRVVKSGPPSGWQGPAGDGTDEAPGGRTPGRAAMTTAPAPLRPPRKPDGPSAASPPPRFSSRRPLLLGFLTLTALAAGLVGWGAFASLSGAVIAAGRVEVETRDQVVEHFDGGTVGAILVRDGTRVAAGDVLLRLDDARLRSEAAVLEAEVAELAVRRNRLEAEFRDARAIVWDAALIAHAEADAAVRDVLDGQQRLFEARRSSQAGQMAQLRERIGQMRKQIAGLEAQTNAVRRQRRFVGRELHVQRVLFKKGLTELPRLLELEREAARLDGQAGDITARIAGARGPDRRDRDPDPPDRRAPRRGGGRRGARGAGARDPGARTPDRGPAAAGGHGGAGAGGGRGLRDAGVCARRGGAPGRADPPHRAGGRGPDGAGATGAHPRGPGVSGPGGGAAVLCLSGTYYTGVRGPHPPGVGGRRP